ncbi:6120_t:CDS:2, partial [Racocetra persica]
SFEYYKPSSEHVENDVLLPEQMADELFNKVSVVRSNKYFENKLDGINFKSSIVLDDFNDKEDTPQEIARKIANLIEEIKNKIKANFHLMPSEIYRTLECNYPEITQKQIHIWWTIFIQEQFIRDSDQIKSSKILLEEHNYQIVMFNDNKIRFLEHELYAIISQYDEVGFALAYLFVEG